MAMMCCVWAIASVLVKNADGVDIWYDLDDTKLEATVVNRGDGYTNVYHGNVVIPEKVVYNGKTYNVEEINTHFRWLYILNKRDDTEQCDEHWR